jgi:hypothetical protein
MGPGNEPPAHWLVVFDDAANGDMASWTLSRLRYRLPEMLIEAGAEYLGVNLDLESVPGT